MVGAVLKFFRKFPWRDFFLVIGLMVLDMSIHPLSSGPDRLIHDPAVYRLANPNYMPGDWYTDMAVKSNVYIFYAKLVNAWQFFHIPEELWRAILYLASLAILYYSLVRIAQVFSKSLLVVPILALLHSFISTGNNQPIWLYGPFIQVDSGLAPRSIGIAISFLALFFLIQGSIIIPSLLLGLATLIHVSNSFIVFTLYFGIWMVKSLLFDRPKDRQTWLEIGRKGGIALLVYLLAGGWFAFYVASQGGGGVPTFPTEKFIWAWIYLRAPYMALPLITKYWWIRLIAHAVSIVFGWLILRKRFDLIGRRALDTLALIGLGSVGYFFIFYFFAFTKPWLPGFEFYSIRVIYLAYFAAYLLISLCLLMISREIISKILGRIHVDEKRYTSGLVLIAVMLFLFGFSTRLGDSFLKPKAQNLQQSWWRLLDDSVVFRARVPENQQMRLPNSATLHYLDSNPEPFLAPPNLQTRGHYFPSVVSFKSFGFTREGLPEWYDRLNDVSRGELEKVYLEQSHSGHASPVYIEWRDSYSKLTQDEILALSRKYNFKLFLSYANVSYSFPVITQDSDFRLYRLPENIKK
jgi:hypothetical protein